MLKKFFLELRRREVFRTAGLYIGIAWIVIEVASVLWPAFELPEQGLRWLVILAVVGFPVSLVLAWIFDISDKGIVVQGDADGTAVLPVGGYTMDFVVIGVLSVALIVSVYLNYKSSDAVVEAPRNLTVFVAEIENRSGNNAFDGALTEAVQAGLAVTPFLNLQNAFGRDDELAAETSVAFAAELSPSDASVLVTGTIAADGTGFVVELQAVEQASGATLFDDDEKASDADDVLLVIDALVAELRDELGDSTDASAPPVTKSAAALHAYFAAEQQAQAAAYEEALALYAKAIELDPQFAGALSGAAFAAFNAGDKAAAGQYWSQAEPLLDRLGERERLRTLARYHLTLEPNFSKAIDDLEQLLAAYPADGAALSAVAQLYRTTGKHDRAYDRSQRLLALYPGSLLLRVRHMEYALTSNELQSASELATALIAEDANQVAPYLTLAFVALNNGAIEKAQSQYQKLAAIGATGASLANAGIADIALFEDRYDDAIAALEQGIAADLAAGNEHGAAAKRIALAEAYAGSDAQDDMLGVLRSLTLQNDLGQLVPAAELLIEHGQPSAAVIEQLQSQPGLRAVAYRHMIDGLLAYRDGDYTGAINAYRDALRQSDLWLVRFHIARAYLRAGYPAEASDEFSSCVERGGEAAALFFDYVPTWRYTAALGEWKAAADRELLGIATSN